MLRVLVPALLLCCVLGGRAEAHIPPPTYMKLHVTDEGTEVHVAAQIGVIRDWFGIEARFLRRPGPLVADDAADGQVHRLALILGDEFVGGLLHPVVLKSELPYDER